MVALAYFGIQTGLIAAAISLSEVRRFTTTWVEQYRWLAPHYVVLCLMGMFLSIAYVSLGLMGIIVFTFPVIMMRYAQKQYVDRTEEGVKELRRLNQELGTANREVVNANRAIRQLNDELFMTLAKVIDARDPFAAGHAATVAGYAAAIAAKLGLQAERLENVRQAALLHDIGKLGIPESILFKPGRLTDDEYTRIKTHAALGGEFLETSQGLRHLAPWVAHHHERWDGRGYPHGLRGDEIPLEARILAVCDAVEAMASDRPYHRAMSLDEIITELRLGAGTQFDPAVVQAFISIVEQKGERYIVNSAQEIAKRQTARQDSIQDSAPWLILQPDTSDSRATL
jgi:putative nucleotidyltransferase with HDIG domain